MTNLVSVSYPRIIVVRVSCLFVFGYSVGRYKFVLQVQISTPYAGGFGMAIPNQ